jgi:hypothetical protein
MEVKSTEAASADGASPVTGRRRRTGKKRLKFGPPAKFPRGVRELWQSATAEEQEKAHRACTLILSMWLGKRRREEVAGELAIPPLRVWQLSQQGLAGMLSGLLRQPRPRRAAKETTMSERDDDPRVLKQRLAEQDKQLANQQELIRLLTSLPKPRSAPSESATEPTPAAKTRTHRARAEAERGRGTVPGNAPAGPR